MNPIHFAALGCFVFCANPGIAEIRFESTALLIKATATEQYASGAFSFTNAGNTAVQIASVSAACLCTTAEAPRTSHQPGESGSIPFRIDLGMDTGKSITSLTVVDNSGASQRLQVAVEIAPLIAAPQRRVFWPSGSDRKTLTLIFDSQVSEPIRISRIRVPGGMVRVAKEEIIAGKQFRLLITPMYFDRPLDDWIEIIAETASGRIKVHSLPVRAD